MLVLIAVCKHLRPKITLHEVETETPAGGEGQVYEQVDEEEVDPTYSEIQDRRDSFQMDENAAYMGTSD